MNSGKNVRHTPEQIENKLRRADVELAKGHGTASRMPPPDAGAPPAAATRSAARSLDSP